MAEEGGGFSNTVVGIIVLLIGIILALMIFWEVNSAIPGIDTVNENNNYEAVWNSTNTTAGTIFSLLPIVAIIIVAGLMLFYIGRFGAGSGV